MASLRLPCLFARHTKVSRRIKMWSVAQCILIKLRGQFCILLLHWKDPRDKHISIFLSSVEDRPRGGRKNTDIPSQLGLWSTVNIPWSFRGMSIPLLGYRVQVALRNNVIF